MSRTSLERHQALIYLAAIGSGLLIGWRALFPLRALEFLLWPLLALLLYTVFTQIPLLHTRDAFTDRRFLQAAIIGNFVIIPVLLWGTLRILPDDPAIRLGVLLVLLVPCTDWFITFTHLGGGKTAYAIAFAPVSLLLQIGLLPLYLWLISGQTVQMTFASADILLAFGGTIALPLLAAFVTEAVAQRVPRWQRLPERLAWLPVPLLALVVFLITVTQVNLITASLAILGQLSLVFGGFLICALALARLLTSVFLLLPSEGRVLAFSFGTRNSFMVLPLALALPSSYELAVVVIVFQSLVELCGMIVFLSVVPRLFPVGKQ
ncbi:arsenic resistance protein [Chloroflexus sp.]|uniref:arsenic resistance protein n=1 Tax=Chloroflexus sp. TaxID=1904827 RepID=UPI002624629A|nr:arsenic resistance protein [uncultured Chloroflexus sp.]